MRANILRRSAWISLIFLLALAAAAWFGGRAYLAGSVMPYSGEQRLAGLDGPVEVLFDARGIPRVYAQSDADAVRALGWLHAGERLFQMELIRRAARGELSEIIGPAAFELDTLHRGVGFARRVQNESPQPRPEIRRLLDAYVAGINARIETASHLPPEFMLLRFSPEPWSVDDVLTVAYYQTWYPNTLVQRLAEAWRDIAGAFGEDATRWLAAPQAWMRASVPATRMAEGSNTWAAAPEKSAGGHALHASDPHLDITLAPGLWYAAGLHSEEGLDVVGVTVPGLPFVAMGHNGRSAWSFTVAPVDVFEFYRDELDPDDPDRVLGPAGPEPVSLYIEKLQVRGENAPVELEIRTTPRGLVIGEEDGALLVMHWAGFDLPVADVIDSGFDLNHAGDFDAFRAAATNMGALSVNWVWSDADGNIAYVQSTPIPKRRHERFFMVHDGSDPEAAWDGFYPPGDRPRALNPEQGWLASANNNAVDESWPYPIPGFYKHLRMRRASAWLESRDRFSADDFRIMQLDRVSDRALAWKDWLADIAHAQGRDDLADMLLEWNGDMDADVAAAGLFARWWHFLPARLFTDSVGPDWRTMRIVQDEWLHAPPENFGPAPEAFDAAARAALEDAIDAGVEPLGAIQRWTIRHPLARSGLLDRWLKLTRGPFPSGGDAGSLNVSYTRWHEADAKLSVFAGPSMRFVLDWADPDAFTLNLTLGQSGHPLSPHFDDFLEDFINGTPWTVPHNRAAVEARAVSTLMLVP